MTYLVLMVDCGCAQVLNPSAIDWPVPAAPTNVRSTYEDRLYSQKSMVTPPRSKFPALLRVQGVSKQQLPATCLLTTSSLTMATIDSAAASQPVHQLLHLTGSSHHLHPFRETAAELCTKSTPSFRPGSYWTQGSISGILNHSVTGFTRGRNGLARPPEPMHSPSPR